VLGESAGQARSAERGPQAEELNMADRVLFVSWGENVAGREERGLEVFNEVVGLYGRKQQEGKIESFDVALFDPNPGIDGYMAIHGSAEQIAELKQDDEFRNSLADASMIVHGLSMVEGYTNNGIAREMERYQAAIAKVPQSA
jgi:hypothetical protein